jgi:hypothetical protein
MWRQPSLFRLWEEGKATVHSHLPQESGKRLRETRGNNMPYFQQIYTPFGDCIEVDYAKVTGW